MRAKPLAAVLVLVAAVAALLALRVSAGGGAARERRAAESFARLGVATAELPFGARAPRAAHAPRPLHAAVAPPPQGGGGDLSRERDPWAQMDAIEAAVKAGRTSAVFELTRIDVERDGYVAGTVIKALGQLAAASEEPAEIRAATQRLVALLASEKRRGTLDARGNVITILEALGDVGTSEAIDALIQELDSGAQPLASEVRIVEMLASLGDRRAAPAVGRFADRLRANAADPEAIRADGARAAARAQAAFAQGS